jgi:hypothetical protein
MREPRTVNARITDKGKGIGRIEWRVNGVTVAAGTMPTGGGPDYDAARQLALDPGDNVIEVVAYNGSNLLASLPAHTTIRFTDPADQGKLKLYVPTIGINKYVDQGWRPPGSDDTPAFESLSLAVDDAIGFGEDIGRASEGLYESVRITPALDRVTDVQSASAYARDSPF